VDQGNPLIGQGNFATHYRWRQESLALGWTHTISSAVVNDLRFGVSRDYAHSDPNGLTGGHFPGGIRYRIGGNPERAGIRRHTSVLLQRPADHRLGSLAAAVPDFPSVEPGGELKLVEGQSQLQIWVPIPEADRQFPGHRGSRGAVDRGGIAITGSYNIGLPDLLLGDANIVIFTTPHVVHYFQPGHSFYGMDTWRANSKLTLTYGVRYELFAPLMDRRNQTTNFTPDNGGGLVTAAPGAGGWYNRALIHPDLDDFAPRLGFAYQMMPRLVWRGGYGVFYQHENRIGSEALLQLNPPQFVDTQLSAGATSDVFQLKNGFPASIVDSTAYNLTQLQIRAQDPNQRTPYVEQASFGFEYQAASDTVLSATYVGNWGRREERVRDYNQPQVTGFDGGCPTLLYPYANLNTVTSVDTNIPAAVRAPRSGQHAYLETATNDGNSDYNGVELALRRRMSKGLSYTLGYTFSHGLANFRDNLTAGQLPQDSYNYAAEMGNSVFDVRSRFVGNFIWELPFGQGKPFLSGPNFAARWLGGWQVNGIVTLQTGTPYRSHCQ
jgi:hypothetical protein